MGPPCAPRPAARAAAASSRPSAAVAVSGFSRKQWRPAARHAPAIARGLSGGGAPGPPPPRAPAPRGGGGGGGGGPAAAARRVHALLDRPLPARGRDFGDPEPDAELAQHAQVLLAPAAEADEPDGPRGGGPGRG